MANNGSVLENERGREMWEKQWQSLSKASDLAGLFRGWKPEGFHESPAKVLYVGKATSGSFHEDNVERDSFNGKGAFWGFARQIATALGCSPQSLQCLAWSNISKISRPQVEADASLLQGFEQQSIETLESEIADIDPDIVVFVTGHFSDKVVRVIAEGLDDSQWTKSEQITSDPQIADIWWHHRADGIPVLWMRHPQGASLTLREYAAKTIVSLV